MPSTHSKVLPLSSEPCSHIESSLQILGKLLFPHFLLVLLVEARHVEFAVVIYLERVTAGVNLNLAIKRLEALRDFFRLLLIRKVVEGLRSVHGQDDAYIDLTGEVVGVVIIGKGAEMQPLDQAMHLAGDIAQIDGRTDDQRVGSEDAVDHRRKVILPEALAALSALSLARHAASASRIIQIEQVDILRFRAYRLRALLRFLQHQGRVPVFARGTI